MIDRDIAELYGVSTKRLNEQVKRNNKRFPVNFMFRLTVEEKQEVVANCDHLQVLKFSSVLPLVFTEHGVLMLANVLQSERAVEMSIKLIEVFVRLREMALSQTDILLKLNQLENQVGKNSEEIKALFMAVKKMLIPEEQSKRKRIGVKQYD
jgi:phage regulator Rha-like protein